MYPNKETADRAFQAVKNNVAEVSKLLKMEINEIRTELTNAWQKQEIQNSIHFNDNFLPSKQC